MPSPLVPLLAAAGFRLDSSEADIWRIWAEALVDLKSYPGALKAYEGLKRRTPLVNQDMAKYGNALVGVGREEEALGVLLEATKDTANCEPFYTLGTLYMKKQNWIKAAEMFEKRITCDTRSLGAYLNAALCYMQPAAKNLPRARELLIGFLIALAILMPIYLAYFLISVEAEHLQSWASIPCSPPSTCSASSRSIAHGATG